MHSETSSQVGDAAAHEWDEGFLLHYILASTCRDIDDLAMAILHGDRQVLAVGSAC